MPAPEPGLWQCVLYEAEEVKIMSDTQGKESIPKASCLSLASSTVKSPQGLAKMAQSFCSLAPLTGRHSVQWPEDIGPGLWVPTSTQPRNKAFMAKSYPPLWLPSTPKQTHRA